MPELFVGTSGFSYDHWRGSFYPEKLAKSRWLGHYGSRFNSLELNVTFYRTPKESTFEKWCSETPSGFSFALKGSRFITHIKRLKDPSEPLERFFSGARLLKDKLGAVLWQLPPSSSMDIERLSYFIKVLKRYRVRNVFEFRDDSWLTDDVHNLLKDNGMAMCMADWPEFNRGLMATADFVYIRRHGREGRYDTNYSDKELKNDAELIEGYLKSGRDVYIFFNNDAEGYAPSNALRLKEIMEV